MIGHFIHLLCNIVTDSGRVIVLQVRGWADRTVRRLGLINPDDYDSLMEVIRWMIVVVEFNLFELSDVMAPENKDTLPFERLPPHLFMPLTLTEYWYGLVRLVLHMDVSTVQTCFMTSTAHADFLKTIVSHMENPMKGTVGV